VEVHPVLLLRGESSRTHSLGRGPDVFSGVHNVCGRLS